MREHANPVHLPLAVAATIGLGYGLWRHSWPWIIGSSGLALAGHAHSWTRDDRTGRQTAVVPQRDASGLKTS